MTPALKIILFSRRRLIPANIAALFKSGEQGGVWMPGVSVFQDSAATIPAAVGGTAVKMLDLSGNGNHVTLTNVTLQQDASGFKYLAAGGTNSSGVTGSINFAATDKMTAVVGARKTSDAAAGIILETSVNASLNSGTFNVISSTAAGANYAFSANGGASYQSRTATTFTAPNTAVLTSSIDFALTSATNEISPRVNGAVPTLTTSVTDCGVGPFGNFPLYFFSRGAASTWFNGRFYGAIVRGAASNASQIADAEAYINRFTGAF